LPSYASLKEEVEYLLVSTIRFRPPEFIFKPFFQHLSPVRTILPVSLKEEIEWPVISKRHIKLSSARVEIFKSEYASLKSSGPLVLVN
jgi:hypothetical protein